jgi:hypothetical protein
VLTLGVTGCGGGGGGGGNDPIFPIEVNNGSKIILEKAHNYGFDYSSQIEVKNISNDQCTYSWNIELQSENNLISYVDSDHKWSLDANHSDTISPQFSTKDKLKKAILIITVGTETKRFNISIVTQ